MAKRPFLRGGSVAPESSLDGSEIYLGERQTATLPRVRKDVVTQDRFVRELDPNSHDVIFDDNLPSICVKVNDKDYRDVRFKRIGLGLQASIRNKKTLALCGNPRVITFNNANPSERDMENFAELKLAWLERNMDGLGTRAAYGQMSYGDVGLLMYMNEQNRICGRVLSYGDGYVIISHNDDNGDRVMECVYYADENDVEHIDCYDDTFLYRIYGSDDEEGWGVKEVVPHGFSEIPLITKRGDVAWNNVQGLIEDIEILWNLFIVIQKRHGWGILYIRGNINENVKRIAGSIILQDTSLDGTGTAEFKTPPTPEYMIQTLDALLEQLQRDASVTFILPKDISTGGDVSGIAMQMTRSLDIEWATSESIEWQNFASKQMRLFKEGLARELVLNGKNPTAITDFADMRVSCKYKMWQPFDESTYNQMLTTMKQGGIISQQTAVEKNTVSTPDEMLRVLSEAERSLEQQTRAVQQQANAVAEPNGETK